MGKHMQEWARARRDADYPEGAVKNAWMDELARAILADAEEQNEPAHPYYWRPWETRPKDAYVLAHWDDGETSVIHPSWLDSGEPDPTHWMPLPPEPNDE